MHSGDASNGLSKIEPLFFMFFPSMIRQKQQFNPHEERVMCCSKCRPQRGALMLHDDFIRNDNVPCYYLCNHPVDLKIA